MNDKTIAELKEKVFTAMGEASMCWDPIPSGVFDSTRAQGVGDKLMEEILSRAEAERGDEGLREELRQLSLHQQAYQTVWKFAHQMEVILACHPTPTPAKDEPLAVLADRKGFGRIQYDAYTDGQKSIYITENEKEDKELITEKEFYAPTYAAAEAKARAYLESLDVKGGR